MESLTTVIISSKEFGGFTRKINLKNYSSLADICDYMAAELRKALTSENFEMLVEILDKTKFHIHESGTQRILKYSPGDIIYVCDHC